MTAYLSTGALKLLSDYLRTSGFTEVLFGEGLGDARLAFGCDSGGQSAGRLLSQAAQACREGRRVAVVVRHDDLLGAVREMRALALDRLPVLVVDVCGGGDRFGSLSLLDHGWIQCMAGSAGEVPDMIACAAMLSGDPCVCIPVLCAVEAELLAEECACLASPASEGLSDLMPAVPVRTSPIVPDPRRLHRDLLASINVLDRVEERFCRCTGCSYDGAFEEYRCDDALHVLVTAGSFALGAREQVDRLRAEGARVGLVRVRYLRPLDGRILALTLSQARSLGVLESDISFGTEGTLFTNINSVLYQQGLRIPSVNFIAGADGSDVSEAQFRRMFKSLMFADSKAADIVQLL